MKRKRNHKSALAALAALCCALCLSACSAGELMDAVFSRLSPIGPGEEAASSGPVQTQLPEDAGSCEGIVLDASGGLLILRAPDGAEYVFRLESVDDRVEGGVAAGNYVRVWYSGVLEGTNARNVKLLRIEAAEETQPDTYDLGSTVEGCVLAFNERSITLRTVSGAEYRFPAGEAVRSLQRELAEGMWVRITFDGTPETAVVSLVTESARAADAYMVIGTLRGFDEQADTVTLQADSGGYYTFRLGDAEIIAPEGLWAGERRFVLSYRGLASPESTENAVLLRMCALDSADPQTLQGTVCAADEARGLIDVCTANGRRLTFYPGRAATRGEKGAQPGDGISLTYEGCISGTYLHEVEIIALSLRGEGAETSVLGTVRTVGESMFLLDTADGRSLLFSVPEGRSLPERMARGDTVRVSYTGWVEGEDTANARYVSVSRAYD